MVPLSQTRSPIFTLETPSPTSEIIPAPSVPGVHGSGGKLTITPSRIWLKNTEDNCHNGYRFLQDLHRQLRSSRAPYGYCNERRSAERTWFGSGFGIATLFTVKTEGAPNVATWIDLIQDKEVIETAGKSRYDRRTKTLWSRSLTLATLL